MYAICRTTHPPTPVEYSTYCHFYSGDEPRNLVTAGANHLKVYRLVRIPSNLAKSHVIQTNFNEQVEFPANESEDFTSDSDVKLECMQSFILNSKIESLNTVSFVGTNRESLLLAFSDAKFSLVEYDPGTHDLKTLSMHYFEEDDMKGGYSYNVRPPMVRVDPENRCAAMLIYSKSIIIIPFRKDVVVEETDSAVLHSVSHETNYSALSNRRYPVLPSYKLDLNNEQYGTNIVNILDIQFLHNYYEPTLLILYEPVRTWSGRVAVRQDTVSMITLSLDVHQRVHPHIWSLTNLPFNAFAALPVPKPIGGVLILCHNALIHLNQGLPPYGISLNCFNDSNTSFPLKTQDSVKVSLDCSQTCFISNNKIIISLSNGDLYLLRLHNDMTRSIRTMNFIHLASSVYSTTLTKCEEGFFFIGSRLSHSLLIHYQAKLEENSDWEGGKASRTSYTHLNKLLTIPVFDETKQTEDEYLYGEDCAYLYPKYNKLIEEVPMETEMFPPVNNKVNHVNGEIPLTNGDIAPNEKFEDGDRKSEVEEMDEDAAIKLLNGDYALEEDILKEEEEEPEEEEPVHDDRIRLLEPIETESYDLRLSDVIYNIAPCGTICLGESQGVTIEPLSRASELFDVELVTTSGFQKSGAITVLQRTIKPRIETSFKLPGCIDLSTVYGPEYFVEEGGHPHHKYLILSQENSTIVFQIGHEINELEDSGFITDNPTILADNLGDSKYILQVCPNRVRLLDGIHQLQQYPVDRPLLSPIIHCSMADPYAALMTQAGQVILLCLKMDTKKGTARIVISQPDLVTDKSRITTLCLYKDVSGLFRTEHKAMPEKVNRRKTLTKKVNRVTRPSAVSNLSTSTLTSAITADDEEELLYGNSTVYFLHGEDKDDEEKEPETEIEDVKLRTINRADPTFWLFLVRENGVLEVYKIPDFKLVYLVKNFPVGTKVLVDSVQATDHSFQTMDALSTPITREIAVTGMGSEGSRPHLFARFDEELIIYEVFPFYELQVENHLKIRFKKITDHYVNLKLPGTGATETETKKAPNNSWLRTFSNISSYSGLFVCGPSPTWFVMSGRGELCIHAMDADGPITSFANFNNININNGFLYFNRDEELRFAVLPSRFEIDSQWPFKHIPIRQTVYFISYHMESKTYAIVTSRSVQIDRIVRVGGDEKDYESIERLEDPRYIPGKMERFYMQLLSPVNWELIPDTRLRLDQWEHVTCLKTVLLASEGTSSGLKGYIAMGTNYAYGEDVTNRGRIWIVDIIEVVPEPGKPLTKNKVKLIYCNDQKGPVTALCQVKGYLLSAIGQKIYIWQLKEEKDLNGIAFIDTQIYVNSAVSVKNLILIGDIYKSISLLRYQEETRTLSLVSRDHKSLQVYACEYLIDNSQMSFIVSDSERNILIYSYQPDTAESLGGTRLLRRGDFHLGSHINSFYRVRCRLPPMEDLDKQTKQTYLQRHMTIFATLDGSIGNVLPISEKTYRRLLMLQNLMVTNVQHLAGLNPKASRMVKPAKLELMNSSKNILDGDLIFRYFGLSLNEKVELAKKIGTSTKQVLDDLQDIEMMTSHF